MARSVDADGSQRKGNDQVMTTKLIVIVGISVATVVLMLVLGKMADGDKNGD